MNKVSSFIKNHFVEVIGFTSILFIILLISYLKVFKKTFICEISEVDNSSKIYQKYTIKQINNKLKTVEYYYSVSNPNAKIKKQVTDFYNTLVNDNYDKVLKNDVRLRSKDNNLVLTYNIDVKEAKNNKSFKNASTLVKNLKASGFTCK